MKLIQGGKSDRMPKTAMEAVRQEYERQQVRFQEIAEEFGESWVLWLADAARRAAQRFAR